MSKTSKNSAALYAGMTEYLESRIAGGALKPGERIMPLRELSKRFGLSASTVRRGIEHLCSKGLLDMRHGSGTYVAANRKPETENGEHAIAVFLFSDDLRDSYCAHALQGVQEQAAKRNWPLRLFFSEYEEMADGGISGNGQTAWDCDAIVMLGCYDSFLRTIPQIRPCVGLEMHDNYGGLFSTLSIDPYAAADYAATYFREQGVRHVRVLAHSHPVLRVRAEVFEMLWRRYGSCEQILFDEWSHLYWEKEDFSRADAGYYSTSGSIIQALAVEFRAHCGKRLCDERRVVAVDGKSLLLPDYEPVNTVALDWRAAGNAVLDETIRRIENPGTQARRIYMNGTFHIAT